METYSACLFITCAVIQSITITELIKKKRMKRKSYNSSKSTSGKSPTVTALGRTNAPYLSGHSKYFFPSTLK